MDKSKAKEVPTIVHDKSNNRTYVRGRFLGKGGFARCWELSDQDTGVKYAGKVVAKCDILKPSQRQKMQQEITIHASLKHENITLMELHKRRRQVTEPEARYFVKQIVTGCQYLHLNNIIHRDLKLANLFLNDDMIVKIGDFGLASRITKEGEMKKTLCGTPNYIAPEILCKHGHSFEVDSWSVGCILYTLLVGRPPFETSSLHDTYEKIKKNDYFVPGNISIAATNLIRAFLNSDPQKRPSMFSVMDHSFFKGFTPTGLPVSALTTCPRFDNLARNPSDRRPLSVIDANLTDVSTVNTEANKDYTTDDCWLTVLFEKLGELLYAPTLQTTSITAMEESEDPACVPIYWVSKWVDYSDKYGIGYHLCDFSNGVLFNDDTRLIFTANKENLQYIESGGKEHLYTKNDYPSSLKKKVTLLTCFTSYMQENLLHAGENIVRRESDNMARLPFLRSWCRTRVAIVLHLSNGTLQLNFFDDHSKIILCPLMEAVTFIDPSRNFKTFRFNLLKKHGITEDLMKRLKYAYDMIDCKLLQRQSELHARCTGVKSKKGSRETAQHQNIAPAMKEDPTSATVGAGKQDAAKADASNLGTNTLGTDYTEIESYYVMAPYLALFFVVCLLINILGAPHKMQLIEFVSIGMMISLYGLPLVVVIVGIMVLLAFIGRSLRGLEILPQIFGLLTLGFILKVMDYVPWIDFKWHLHASSLSYAGFYAHVVRAMLLCCEYAGREAPVDWRRLLSESIGFPASTGVFMPASFVLFTDWLQWRDGQHEFKWSGPFQMAPKKLLGKATVVRTLSLGRLLLRALRIAFWCLVHKYVICSTNFVDILAAPFERILKSRDAPEDWFLICFAAYMFTVRFNVFYVIFYNLSRLLGDLQQFLLSPAFAPNTTQLVKGDPNAERIWKEASLIGRWLRVELKTECLMPEGPCCLPVTFTSSEIWRYFDVGLYNVLKHHIYIPWMKLTMAVLGKGAGKDNKKQSSLVPTFAALVGAACTYIFVLTFHSWSEGNCLWVSVSFILWMVERLVKHANKLYAICDSLSRRLSPSWEQRIRCLGCALLQTCNMMSFFCFLTNFDSGWFFITTMLTRPYAVLLFSSVLYCSYQMKLALRT
ncbi:Serine/threonine-protein kinase PLK1 [Taenia crassiceps]|uniref:Serine/threonine-protein kinase PLK n=1 Tax=Taenia crassiceps TaxID=6207 RepID=A0ABR4QCM6_9CEST